MMVMLWSDQASLVGVAAWKRVCFLWGKSERVCSKVRERPDSYQTREMESKHEERDREGKRESLISEG